MTRPSCYQFCEVSPTGKGPRGGTLGEERGKTQSIVGKGDEGAVLIFLRRDHRPPRRKSRPEDIHSLLSATGRLEVELHPPPLPSGPCPGPRLPLCCTQHVVTIHCHVGYLFFLLHRWRSWMLRRTVAEEEAARHRWDSLQKSNLLRSCDSWHWGPIPYSVSAGNIQGLEGV